MTEADILVRLEMQRIALAAVLRALPPQLATVVREELVAGVESMTIDETTDEQVSIELSCLLQHLRVLAH